MEFSASDYFNQDVDLHAFHLSTLVFFGHSAGRLNFLSPDGHLKSFTTEVAAQVCRIFVDRFTQANETICFSDDFVWNN
jgi:hypothetical protein